MGAHTIVIGGGMAGIAAATSLAEQGIPTTLIEKRAFLGGRTISIQHRQTGEWIDNGQHALMGCYRQTFDLLKRLGTLEGIHFQDTLNVVYRGAEGFSDTLRCPHLPSLFHLLGPIHLAVGLWRMKSFGLADLWAASKMRRALQGNPIPNETIEELCRRLNQPGLMKQLMWSPIAISALNVPIAQADVRLFAEVMKQAFFGKPADSRLALPSVGLSDLYAPAETYISERSGRVILGESVSSLSHDATLSQDGGRATHAHLSNGETLECDQVILAVPEPAARKIIERSNLADKISILPLGSSPILSVYLWFDAPLSEEAVCCLIDLNFEWIFHRNRFMRPGEHDAQCVCLVKSAAQHWMAHSRDDLIQMALSDIKSVYPEAASQPPIASHVFWERHATFVGSPQNANQRPGHKTAIENIYLAGDWTDTGLPATIEGAVRSGHSCADLLLNS